MKVYQTITDTIGHTPLLEVTKIEAEEQAGAKIFAKLELFNPAGSVKDRVAAAMINDAEKRGVLKPDSVIIEPTSGFRRCRKKLPYHYRNARNHER